MLLFAARRLAILLATLAFASLIVFAALEVLPGNAAQVMLGTSATPDAVAALAHKLGIDGTPTFVLNGKMHPGALDDDTLAGEMKS